ncbi:tRNA uridine-5-carboxymethylaminomethyl(34) synthesis GTPase MnmE [Pseudoflavonifractor sp. MSJ-37]|uniref:tRNA uridine-5-carboxymethylaminomethyl(34) synthesis GTPase MnmE n=1 Tax=Pseudoflavonifractor sp. MSJ-37 TaxID=2841531 RepID=UPI001C11EDA6|nr:tRNA uridine-5-carboxymethylaminomethyl(34) synthesis GTPase MnmE [Pseudoflavonifractor sp. MSJ-37]MBU5435362.1 tRNA uridine-5-carboxymethylaminomethyl(34) synthesis GTPase MnmE [Pseudoflavonifractor sp. MSJ-37]
MSDTIAAIATGPGRSAVGILRLSGPEAIPAADAVFRAGNGRSLAACEDRRLVLGALLDREGRPVDQVLATVSRAPHSYTGEDTAELQCHGSPAVLALGLEALSAHGVRQAGPGEFTRRAFLNGRLDLMQAEAVADLIDAETEAGARAAAGQLSGALSRRVKEIYDALVDVSAHFHAVLDYPDEDIDAFGAETLDGTLGGAERALSALLATYRRGKLLTGGIPCAIVGRPNAGKSSLLNALLGYERAIVTDVPGTTRDTVEEKCVLGGRLLRLIDTAGIRDTADAVERIGVERSRKALEGAALALVLTDLSAPPAPEDRDLLALALERAERVVLVGTKRDLAEGAPEALLPPDQRVPVVRLSARTGQGLEELERTVAALFPADMAEDRGELLTNARQAGAAEAALEQIRSALDALAAGVTPDAVLVDVEGAMEALGQLTGQSVREDVTARIFARFCVGK